MISAAERQTGKTMSLTDAKGKRDSREACQHSRFTSSNFMQMFKLNWPEQYSGAPS